MSKVKQLTTSTLNNKYYGRNEPEFKGNVVTEQGAFIRALNWYNATQSSEQGREFLLEYVSQFHADAVKRIAAIGTNPTVSTMGWLARMVSRGITLRQFDQDKLTNWIATAQPVVSEINKVYQQTAAKYVSQSSKANQMFADLEEIVDQCDPEFSMYKYLTSNAVPQQTANQIFARYKGWASELVHAYKRTDPDFIEAYAFMNKDQLARTTHFMLSILDDCQRYASNQKKAKKPRAIKAKKPEAVLKHFVYSKGDDKLKISSINPQAILGASELYVLNTSNNVLTMFYAKEGGLSVHRTAISNYDESKSKSLRVGRKLDHVIQAVLNATKSKVGKSVLDLVASQPSAASERINTSTVLLRVIK